MVMDHPFFYAIQDDATGALLFVGVMMNPAQT
jgi:serine protease inhibitor